MFLVQILTDAEMHAGFSLVHNNLCFCPFFTSASSAWSAQVLLGTCQGGRCRSEPSGEGMLLVEVGS